LDAQLVNHAERALTLQGRMKINLQIVSTNESVKTFYESLGYLSTSYFGLTGTKRGSSSAQVRCQSGHRDTRWKNSVTRSTLSTAYQRNKSSDEVNAKLEKTNSIQKMQ
jgi:hypothetical protein